MRPFVVNLYRVAALLYHVVQVDDLERTEPLVVEVPHRPVTVVARDSVTTAEYTSNKLLVAAFRKI